MNFLFITTISFIFFNKPVEANEIAAKDVTWAEELAKIIKKDPALQGATVGVSIRNASNGQIIYQHQGNLRLRPASNMKLLTAAAALKVLGENYTFSTEVVTDGKVKGKRLRGNLYLRGKGDPTLLVKDFDVLAIRLKSAGIEKIQGDLLGDDTWYDDVRYAIDVPWSDETTYYGAQISALSASPTADYDAGTINVNVQANKVIGKRPLVKLTPNTNYVTIVNAATTTDQKEKTNITIKRTHGSNTIHITGTIPVHSKEISEGTAVWNPSTYALKLFQQSLIKQGIELTGSLKMAAVPKNGNIILKRNSIPLKELLVPFMKLSNNTHGEILVKEMGKTTSSEGSWDAGLAVLNSVLAQWGLNTKSILIRDGSGISHVTGIPANEISQLLYAVQEEKWFPVYLNSLPVAGIPEKLIGGSLRYRMNTPDLLGKVRAKTGTLSTVSSLSGYVTTRSGKTLIFSILINNLLDEKQGKRIEDQLVSIIANQ
ncbi:D-alanyl-D-alanine carboxypeptidase/D-alanyl-D-alanine endopeptidase [Bacillus rubiinfantis]|uniref:D-alanyl-D-alanine carboxypeptidase/D-alanyl-D-alanine endopeptidase n=1 Tax=Bacillus rubiinfantis TaxID=1499680 RepID=UPI0006941397|nr:D-alanyl-D-alanine carboxypeptidase/D-alanyl-D-alanine-endopeptidase [Bacillus rubiinfantis]